MTDVIIIVSNPKYELNNKYLQTDKKGIIPVKHSSLFKFHFKNMPFLLFVPHELKSLNAFQTQYLNKLL